MMAYIVEWGWFKLGTYGLMMACGFLVAYLLLRKDLIRRRLDPDLAARITFNAAIWGVIGARLLSVIEEPGRIADHPIRSLLLEGGLTWYGGLLAGALATVYTILKARAPLLSVIDAMTPAAFVGYAFGRMGCLISGDGCYGQATDLPWGMSFPNAPEEPGLHCLRLGAIAKWPPMNPDTGMRYPEDVAVHPTPIYEAIVAVGMFALLWVLRKRIRRPGVMLGLFFILAAVPRFLVEFIRLNPRYASLSLSQWISIALLVLGVGLIVRSRALPDPAEAGETVDARPTPGGRKKRRRR